jgi:hypothetical protein
LKGTWNAPGLSARLVIEATQFFSWALVKLREAQAAPPGVWPFPSHSGNLTGEDARPTLWRGRPRPRSGRHKRLRLEFGHFQAVSAI